jgi:hypothetical protein
MASDFDLQTLTRIVARSQLEYSQAMDTVAAVPKQIAAKHGLQPTQEQIRQVAQPLSPKLAQTDWPDSTSTSFKRPAPGKDKLP